MQYQNTISRERPILVARGSAKHAVILRSPSSQHEQRQEFQQPPWTSPLQVHLLPRCCQVTRWLLTLPSCRVMCWAWPSTDNNRRTVWISTLLLASSMTRTYYWWEICKGIWVLNDKESLKKKLLLSQFFILSSGRGKKRKLNFTVNWLVKYVLQNMCFY